MKFPPKTEIPISEIAPAEEEAPEPVMLKDAHFAPSVDNPLPALPEFIEEITQVDSSLPPPHAPQALQTPAAQSAPPSTKRFLPDGVDMKYLVRALVKYNASDLHLKPGRPPLYRINGRIIAARATDLTLKQIESIVLGLLSERQITQLEEKRQIDMSFKVSGLGRFRCNIYYQKGNISAAVRMIPLIAPNIDHLGLPPVLKELCHRQRGLLLVTGPTGSGKSTSLAAMVQNINETCQLHIITIEDPIEFVYRDVKSTITQREVGSDIFNHRDALYAGLRQDPDVIMIGELRDCETIQAALTAAETGHLVIATLHTNDARSTIDRILDVFPAEAQNQARYQLASVLVGVVAQQLIPKADGTGRVLACEVMVKSPVIEKYIFNNQLDRINEAIASSNNYYQMQSTNQALERLVRAKTISLEVALRASQNPDDLKLKLAGVSREEGYEVALQDYGVRGA